MVGQCWGVDRWVRVSRHFSAMEDAKGVSTKGGVGVAMFNGGSLFGSTAPGPLGWGWLLGSVKVPHRRWQVPIEGWGVDDSVVALVRRGGSQDGQCFPMGLIALFICSTGTRR